MSFATNPLRRVPLGWALCLSLSLCPTTVWAAHWSQHLTKEARRAYAAGTTLFRDGDFAGAAHKFREAYDRDRDPRLLWNLIVSRKNERDYAAVSDLTERYLQQHREQLSDADRADAQKLLNAVQQFVVYVHPIVNADEVELSVDGKVVGQSPFFDPVRLNMGEHSVVATKEGYTRWTARKDWAGGEHVTMEVVLQSEMPLGTLVVETGDNVAIVVDGTLRGTGQFEGALEVGEHQLQLTSPGSAGYTSPLAIEAGETTVIRLQLADAPSRAPADAFAPTPAADSSSGPVWPWLAGGAGLAVVGVAAFFLRPQTPARLAPISGTAAPGVISLP